MLSHILHQRALGYHKRNEMLQNRAGQDKQKCLNILWNRGLIFMSFNANRVCQTSEECCGDNGVMGGAFQNMLGGKMSY